MRAGFLRSNLVSLALLPERECAELARARDAIEAAVEGRAPTAWLPVELDVELSRAVQDQYGPERTRQWVKDALADSTSGPVLRPLFAALQALGFTPVRALERTPRIWSMIYRDCGTCEVTGASEGQGECVIRDLPAMLQEHWYLSGVAGGLEGLLDLAGADRALVSTRVEGNTAKLRARWG